MHSDISLNLVEEKVQQLVDLSSKASFEEFEIISRDFERASKGYKHSPYLCYIATHCWGKLSQYCVFKLGAGQGKTFIGLLLAQRHS